MDQITTPHLIDASILGATLLLGLAGFWRGVTKEVFISASILLGYALAFEWADRWGLWVADQTRFSEDEGMFAVSVAILLLASVLIGYVGCTMAGLPPADAPGRLGGLVLGTTNATVVIALTLTWATELVLSDQRIQTVRETEVARRLSGNQDWVMLGAVVAAMSLVITSWQVRRRRIVIVAAARGQRPADSGFSFRRAAALAPEAEKIERQTGALASWPPQSTYAETTALTRVPDPSTWTDRPVSEMPPGETRPIVWQTDEVIRCISCGERIGDHDKYCPRCGRQLT